jgi:hypothetical protein
MNVALWAEIRRLVEIDKLSGREIAQRLHCSRHTVAAALELQQPPAPQAARRVRLLDPYLEQIKDLLARYPDLSAVRIREEIARGPQGYTGSASVLRRYLRQVRPARGRVYQEVHYQLAQAMQVDWGECGRVPVGSTMRKVSVFVAVLCYSRLVRPHQQTLEREFDAWGPEARAFHLGLSSRPVKTGVHVRRLLGLAQLYGRTEVLAAMARALELTTYRCRLRGESAAGGAPPPAAPHTDAPHSPTPRAARRHRAGTRRPSRLRPLLPRHRGGCPWHDLTSPCQHNWNATSPS